jgi:hypothetical protein
LVLLDDFPNGERIIGRYDLQRAIGAFVLPEVLGKVHDVPGVLVDGDRARHGRGSAVFGAAGQVGAFARVVLLFYQVVASAEGDQVGVVGGSGDGDGAGAADVGVAKLKCFNFNI